MKLRYLAVLALALAACNTTGNVTKTDQNLDISTQAIDGTTRQIFSGGAANLGSSTVGSDAIQWPEFPTGFGDEGSFVNGGGLVSQGISRQSVHQSRQLVNRSRSQRGVYSGVDAGSAASGSGLATLAAPAQKLLSFDGVNFRNQRLANSGNQFSLEPPDQALCVGNGFELESVNDVLRIYDAQGNPATPVIDLNTFYNYPAAINRATGARGPFITDPICHYDSDTKRWFHVVLTLDVVSTSGAFTGKNHLDIAVSDTSNPMGSWRIYRLPVQNDGTDGTINHNCSLEEDSTGAPSGNGPCIGDYPHIGMDRNGVYLTTNEYSFFGPEYKSANIYAISKKALTSGASSIGVVEFQTIGAVNGKPGFTVWPAISPRTKNDDDFGGTEFFLSSNAAEEAEGTGVSNQIITWALANTRSLDTTAPRLRLLNKTVRVGTYAVPPRISQKAGSFPLGECLNDSSSTFGPGLGCWALFVGAKPPTETLSKLDGNDSRMQQVSFVDGKLFGALDTGTNVSGQVAIAYYVFDPEVKRNGLSVEVERQGYVSVPGNSLTRPAIAMTSSGKGVMGFTVVGPDYHPSAGFAGIDGERGAGPVQIAELGKGPQDGFSGYNAFAGSGVARPRWGDYGAAATDGNTIWVANEYIAQTCTLAQYLTSPIGSCGGTRASLANWATRVTQVKP